MKLSIQNISKTYANKVRALDNITLDIKAGMFGLLGPNGAGKSSLMRTVATLQEPDRGVIIFEGSNILQNRHEFRKSLGYLPQDFGVYPKETAQSLLNYFAILKGVASKKDREYLIDKVLQTTNLVDTRKQKVSTFSGGMRQRFGIAQLLLNDPKLMIVDEPTAGLDPSERSRFLNVLRNLGTENIVIFSTHLVEDVRELCNDMAIINHGKLLEQIDPKEAVRSLEGKIWSTTQAVDHLDVNQIHYTVLSHSYNDNNEKVTRVYAENSIENFVSVSPKLEDHYFLTLEKA